MIEHPALNSKNGLNYTRAAQHVTTLEVENTIKDREHGFSSTESSAVIRLIIYSGKDVVKVKTTLSPYFHLTLE